METLTSATIKRIHSEIKEILDSPIEGIKVIPPEDDIRELNAIVYGPEGTPYESGQFKMKLKFGSDYPLNPPKGFFLTKIFHPNVADTGSNTGEICVNTLKKDWKNNPDLKHVLMSIRCLLIAPNPESALNAEAGQLLLENYDSYASRAKLFTSIHATKPLTKDIVITTQTPPATVSVSVSLSNSSSNVSLTSSSESISPSPQEAKENSDTNSSESKEPKDPKKKVNKPTDKTPTTTTTTKKTLTANDKKKSFKKIVK